MERSIYFALISEDTKMASTIMRLDGCVRVVPMKRNPDRKEPIDELC